MVVAETVRVVMVIMKHMIQKSNHMKPHLNRKMIQCMDNHTYMKQGGSVPRPASPLALLLYYSSRAVAEK